MLSSNSANVKSHCFVACLPVFLLPLFVSVFYLHFITHLLHRLLKSSILFRISLYPPRIAASILLLPTSRWCLNMHLTAKVLLMIFRFRTSLYSFSAYLRYSSLSNILSCRLILCLPQNLCNKLLHKFRIQILCLELYHIL